MRRNRHKRRTHCNKTHKLRILLTIAAKEKNNIDAPDGQWFSEAMWRTVSELIADGLVSNGGKGIRLTAAGLKFIATKLKESGD